MKPGAAPTNIQGWLRDHSNGLINSFRSSARIRQSVTKGESREHQILDSLSKLLPTRVAVEPNVVIVDSTDVQSPKFDGGLVDRNLWPRLFADGKTAVVMIESVLTAIEIKSSLNKSEIDDIFKKASKLRAMRSGRVKPMVTAFAYKCPNPNLHFFDFATAFYRSPEASPSSICILNKHLYGLARREGGRLVPEDQPTSSGIPVLYSPAEDTLLVYLHTLSQLIAADTTASGAFTRYSENVFSKMIAFHFDLDFVTAVMSSDSKFRSARNHFKRQGAEDITVLYEAARRTIGLP